MIYEPSDDSFLLEEQVKRYSRDKSVLDMGSGSGIQALAAKNSGASSVLAIDINPHAVKHISSQGLNAKKSNLFSNVPSSYDLIIFNPPYLPEDPNEPKDSMLATTGGKNGDELILKFLTEAPLHLNRNGKILLLVSSLTPMDKIDDLLKRVNFESRVLSHKKIFMEKLEVLELTRKPIKAKSSN